MLDSKRNKRGLSWGKVQSGAIWYALLLLLIIGAFASPHFLTWDNLINIVRQTAVVGLLAMGMTVIIISGALDFTLGAVLALTTITIALLQGYSGWVVLPLLILIAITVGLVNSIVVTKLRLESFIATLAVSLLIEGIAHFISRSQAIPVTNSAWRLMGSGHVVGIPFPIIVFVLVGIVLHLLLTKTVFGRYLYATGGNPSAARISGVPTGKIQAIAFIIGALIAVIAGTILTGRIASGDPNIGLVMTLDAIIISVLGGAALHGGKGSILGAISGALVITVLFNIFNMINLPVYAQMVARGVILLLAIAAQRR